MFCGAAEVSVAASEWSGTVETNQKPLPLKQRTSSSTDRRDFSSNTWISLLELIKIREYFITVNHFSIWRRHNAWSMEDGKDLKAYITQRYASSMVFMSLLLSTECGVLFNSAAVTAQVRQDLVEAHWNTVSFWAGLFLIVSALCTILSLISTFTFTAMISAIDEANAHCILRSSIGQYTTELPGRLIVGSIYSFLISFMSFFFLLLPLGYFSICLLLLTVGFFVHVVSVFSSFGRIIMHTGAMSKDRIFSSKYEESLVPHSLHSNLLSKARCNIANNISIIRQYRTKQRPIDRYLFEDELYDHLSGNPVTTTTSKIDMSSFTLGQNRIGGAPNRLRADSKVRFADEESGLVQKNHKKEVIGETNSDGTATTTTNGRHPSSNYYGTSSHHFRSLTPLSDISSVGSQLDPLTGRSTEAFRFFDGKPPVISTEFPATVQRDTSSVQTVSNASLEQWLQGSSGSEAKDETKTVVDEKPPAVPPPRPAVSVNTTITNNSWSISNGEMMTRSIEKGRLIRKKSVDLYRMDEREMSEDERFLFDYGDIGSYSEEDTSEEGIHNNNDNNRNGNHMHDTTPQQSNTVNDKDLKAKGNDDSTHNERTQLLP